MPGVRDVIESFVHVHYTSLIGMDMHVKCIVKFLFKLNKYDIHKCIGSNKFAYKLVSVIIDTIKDLCHTRKIIF